MRESSINDFQGKLVFIKMDSATRQLRSFLGINVQYDDKNKDQSVVKMLACANTEKRFTSQQCATYSLQQCSNLALQKKFVFGC